MCLSFKFYADWSKISKAHKNTWDLLFIKYYSNKENGQNVSAMMMKNMQDIERKQISRFLYFLRQATTTLSHSNLWHCILELVGCVSYPLLLKDFPELAAQMRNVIYHLEVIFSICTRFPFMCFLYFSLHNQLLQHRTLKISFVLSQSGLTQSVFLTSHLQDCCFTSLITLLAPVS